MNELALWINFYCKECPKIAAIVNLFEMNENRLFLKTPPEKPSWDLEFSPRLTKKVYVLVVKKIFSVFRYLLYKEIRKIQRERRNTEQNTNPNQPRFYITKNEVRKILENINTSQIR